MLTAETTESKVDLAIDLLQRLATKFQEEIFRLKNDQGICRVNGETLDEAKLRIAMYYANGISEVFGENPPDERWFGEFYHLTGEHMVMTDEGWIPAEYNTLEYTGYEPMEVFWEVNAP